MKARGDFRFQTKEKGLIVRLGPVFSKLWKKNLKRWSRLSRNNNWCLFQLCLKWNLMKIKILPVQIMLTISLQTLRENSFKNVIVAQQCKDRSHHQICQAWALLKLYKKTKLKDIKWTKKSSTKASTCLTCSSKATTQNLSPLLSSLLKT